MDHKSRKIVNDLRLISVETNLAYYTENSAFSALYKDRRRHFSLLHSLRPETTTNVRPAAPEYSLAV